MATIGDGSQTEEHSLKNVDFFQVKCLLTSKNRKSRTLTTDVEFVKQPLQPRRPSQPYSKLFVIFFSLILALDQACLVRCLSCYVCGGSTGRPCGEISTRRKSPYIRPQPILTADGEKQWEECKDLINNKGCIKQVVNDVVLLRACWMQGSPQCLVDGTATVCTCKEDLCNGANPRNFSSPLLIISILIAMLGKRLGTL